MCSVHVPSTPRQKWAAGWLCRGITCPGLCSVSRRSRSSTSIARSTPPKNWPARSRIGFAETTKAGRVEVRIFRSSRCSVNTVQASFIACKPCLPHFVTRYLSSHRIGNVQNCIHRDHGSPSHLRRGRTTTNVSPHHRGLPGTALPRGPLARERLCGRSILRELSLRERLDDRDDGMERLDHDHAWRGEAVSAARRTNRNERRCAAGPSGQRGPYVRARFGPVDVPSRLSRPLDGARWADHDLYDGPDGSTVRSHVKVTRPRRPSTLPNDSRIRP